MQAFPFYHALGLVHKYNDGILSKQTKIKNHCFVTKTQDVFLRIFHLARCGHCIRFNFRNQAARIILGKSDECQNAGIITLNVEFLHVCFLGETTTILSGCLLLYV